MLGEERQKLKEERQKELKELKEEKQKELKELKEQAKGRLRQLEEESREKVEEECRKLDQERQQLLHDSLHGGLSVRLTNPSHCARG